MTDDPIDPVAEEKQALDRIARTHDGVLLHRYLRRVLETVVDLQDDGALRTQNGRRTLARDLMRMMASGIEGTSDGRSDQRGDEPILGRAAKPVGSGSGLSRAEQRRQFFAEQQRLEQPSDDNPS